MQWVDAPHVLLFVISAAVSGMLALYVWERRSVSGAIAFGGLMVSAALWAITGIVEILAVDLPSKLVWYNLKYIWIVSIPVLWVTFASQYTRNPLGLKRRNLFLLALLPVFTLILQWTNPSHHLVHSEARLALDGPFVYIAKEYGPWFWIWTAYAYALMLLGSVYLLQFLARKSPLFSRQIIFLSLGIIFPWAGNGMYISQLLPWIRLDITPVALSLSGMVVAWGVFRLRLADVGPIARAVVVENMMDGVLIFDPQARLVDINPAARKILALSNHVTASAPYRQVLSRFPELVEHFLDRSEIRQNVMVSTGTEELFFDARISTVLDSQQNMTGKLVVLRDISEHKRAEQDLEKSHQLLEATLEATADGILVVSARDKSIRYNRKFLEMWRIPAEVINQASEQRLMAYILDQLINPAAFYRLMNKLSNQLDPRSYDVLELKDGRVFERSSQPQRIGDVRVGRVWSFRDITEQRRWEEKLTYLSTHDILTGLYNRVYFEEEINRLEKGRQFPISMIMADVDDLKQTNDQYGHQAGDELLRKAAEILRQACRSEDMVARLGGDEFGILLPFSDATAVESAMQRIRNMLGMSRVGEGKITISLSLGSATAENGQSLRKVLQMADKVMYQAKSARSRRRIRPGRVEDTPQS